MKDPHYTMEGFEIHVADTLSPTAREQTGTTGEVGERSSLEQFAADNGRARSFIEDRDAVDRVKDEVAFDVVVANPPYVCIQSLSGMKDAYSARYASAIKNFDIYVPFIERGLEWLTDDGKLTYICPNRLLTNDYVEAIRDRLVDDPISHLLDFKDTKVFDAATPCPCIHDVNREQQVGENEIQCAPYAEGRPGVLDEIFYLDAWETPSKVSEYDLYRHPQSRLVEDNRVEYLASWKPMPGPGLSIYDKIISNADYRLGEVTDSVFQGLITGLNDVFVGEVVGEEDGLVQFMRGGGSEPESIEKDHLRRLLKGNEIDLGGADWEGLWLLFPYTIQSGGG